MNSYSWSDEGATKIAKIILRRFTNAKAWEDYWQNKMNCAGNIVVNIGNYKCFSQNLSFIFVLFSFVIQKDETLQKDFLHPTDLYTKHLLLRHSAKKI